MTASSPPEQETPARPERRRFRSFARSPLGIGVLAVAATLAVGWSMFEKDMLATVLLPGDTVRVQFAQDYRLRAYVTPIKIGGVKVGRVSDVEQQPDGTALVTAKIDSGMAAALGTEPSAAVRPTILLGGYYYLDLKPGGTHTGAPFTGTVPAERTTVPVELDKVAAVLQPDAVQGLRSSTRQLDATVQPEGRSALQDLARDAPGALDPATPVLQGLAGNHPDDLTRVVSGLDATTRTLTAQDGQLDGIVADLATTSRVLGARSQDTATAVANLPQTLDTTDAGLKRLDGTLARLRETAGPAGPVVDELGPLVDRATPVLARALPVVRDLRQVVTDARPMVDDLVPTSEIGTAALDDLRGPVLDRLNGPVLNTVMSPYSGTGPYAGSGDGDVPLYQELGYMASNIDRASKMTDGNGANVGFQPGVGAGTVEGVPIDIESLWANLAQIPNPEHGR